MELEAQVAIDVPAHAAGAVVGDRLGQIGEWACPITTSCLHGEPAVGAIRTCQIAGFGPFKAGVINERLVEFNSAAMSLAYEELPRDAELRQKAINRWSVHPHTKTTCLVRTRATLDLRRPLRLLQFAFERRLQADGARVLQELRYQVEHGRPHPRTLRAA